MPGAIEVYISTEGSGEKNLIDRLEDDGNAFISSKLNKELSEELLDEYLKTAFAETLESSLAS